MSRYDDFELDIQNTNVKEFEDIVMKITYTATGCPTQRESICTFCP